MHCTEVRMAQAPASSCSDYDDESLLDIEVLRKEGCAGSSASLATLVAGDSSTEGGVQTYYPTLTRRNHTKLKPSNGRGNILDNRNGCCHSTPLQGSACENWLLKDYFSRIPQSVVSFTTYIPFNILLPFYKYYAIIIHSVLINAVSRVPANLCTNLYCLM